MNEHEQAEQDERDALQLQKQQIAFMRTAAPQFWMQSALVAMGACARGGDQGSVARSAFNMADLMVVELAKRSGTEGHGSYEGFPLSLKPKSE